MSVLRLFPSGLNVTVYPTSARQLAQSVHLSSIRIPVCIDPPPPFSLSIHQAMQSVLKQVKHSDPNVQLRALTVRTNSLATCT